MVDGILVEVETLNKENLRKTFIAFLFAFVTSRLLEPIYKIASDIWLNSWNIFHTASILQIMVALVIITTGWVGWTRTAVRVGGELKEVWHDRIFFFSEKFSYLINDIAILILFYFLVSTIDSGSMVTSQTYSDDGPKVSFVPELWISLGIMICYLIFRLLGNYLGKIEERKTLLGHMKFKTNREWIFTALFLVLTVIMMLIGDYIPKEHTITATVIVDTVVMIIFIYYRAVVEKDRRIEEKNEKADASGT